MNTKRRIFRESYVDIEVIREPDEELVRHISGTVLGTPGGLRYRHKRVREKIRNLGTVFFMILRVRKRLLGSVGLVKRECIDMGSFSTAWYVRYFSIQAPLRSHKHENSGGKKAPRQDQGLLKGVSSVYFENPFKLSNPEDEGGKKTYIYAYIEGKNERSLRFSEQMGLQKVRTFKTSVFSRFRSRSSKHCRLLNEDEIPSMQKRLEEFYSDHTMLCLENLNFASDYWVFVKDGTPAAGTKIHRASWELAEMKGLTGVLLFRVLPGLPFFRRFIQPDDFRFIALEGIWHAKGEEGCLNELISHIAKVTETPLIMTWADPGSRIYRSIDEKVDKGIAGRLFHPVSGEIRVKFVEFSENEKNVFLKNPAYLSAFDMI